MFAWLSPVWQALTTAARATAAVAKRAAAAIRRGAITAAKWAKATAQKAAHAARTTAGRIKDWASDMRSPQLRQARWYARGAQKSLARADLEFAQGNAGNSVFELEHAAMEQANIAKLRAGTYPQQRLDAFWDAKNAFMTKPDGDDTESCGSCHGEGCPECRGWGWNLKPGYCDIPTTGRCSCSGQKGCKELTTKGSSTMSLDLPTLSTDTATGHTLAKALRETSQAARRGAAEATARAEALRAQAASMGDKPDMQDAAAALLAEAAMWQEKAEQRLGMAAAYEEAAAGAEAEEGK
jgi:hypothetical protein